MMRVRQLDPEFARQRRNGWKKAAKFAAGLVGLMWMVWLLDVLTPFTARYLSIFPRQPSALSGIIFAPLLHSGLSHLISNTLPVFLAILALLGNYPKIARRVLLLAWLGTGALVWLFARSSWHLGASGLLYALLSFLFVSGFMRRDTQSVAISLVLVFLYGGLVFGVIPDKPDISWESHLFGAVMGITLAWWFRKEDQPVFRHYDLEDNEEERGTVLFKPLPEETSSADPAQDTRRLTNSHASLPPSD